MTSSAEAARPVPARAASDPPTVPEPTASDPPTVPEPLDAQAERLVELGVPHLAGVTAAHFRRLAADLVAQTAGVADALLAVHPDFVPVRRLATLMTHKGKQGFVVVDMTDLEEFVPLPGMELPSGPLYAVRGVDRGDEMRNWSPEEALGALTDRHRTPLTIAEGVSWLLQQPERLEANHCFMCIGSRKPSARGLDARTPAIWISGGTGRDGKENRNAPKVGWCWARNRHTWLGFASAAGRVPSKAPAGGGSAG